MPKSIEQNVDKSCTEVLASLFNTLRYTAIDTALLSLIALITASTMVRVLWLESQRASLEIREERDISASSVSRQTISCLG
jgi:hypothetical protein